MATRDDVLPLPASGYGQANQAMKEAEADLAQQLSTAAEFDRQVIEALRQAHKTTVEGRRRLDGLAAEIAAAAQVWDLSTAAGAREFQRFLIAKLSEIIRVVEDANDDDASKQALAAALMTLYAAQSSRDDPASPPTEEPGEEFAADPETDPYPDLLADDDPVPSHQAGPQVPAMPMVPGFGGDGPGFGAMPAAMPAGITPASLMSGLDRGELPGEDEYSPEHAADADDPAPDGVDAEATDGEGAQERLSDNGPVTVRLPDGATTSVADPQLAAAMQAAADGQPVAEAFRRQGIDLPPPGTPVAAPIDATRLRPGDIGVFTDRHALAVGDGKALLDGQVHLVGNLRGPGFLGWQHPPVQVPEPAAPAGQPAPTRPAMALGGAESLKNPVSTVIVD